MRVYIIGNDGITLCRKAPATVTDGEVAVGSNPTTATGRAAVMTTETAVIAWSALFCI
jgi:hypothetical protein